MVIDKALLDALCCAEVPSKTVHKYLQEVDRVLSPTGLFVCVSYGLPEMRLDMLDNTDEDAEGFLAWDVEVHAIPKPMVDPYKVSKLQDPNDVYYVYTCKKTDKMDNEKELKKKAARARAMGKKLKQRRK